MKRLTSLIFCLSIAAAPLALAQTQPQKPPAKPQPGPARVLVETKADARTESCNKQASAKSMRGEEREMFMTNCLK